MTEIYRAHSSCVNFVERLLRPSALLDLANILKFASISAMLLERKIRCQNSHNLSGRGITIQVGSDQLFGELNIPDKAIGLVLFAHGSGSGRHSPRNQFVARFLESKKLGTLLFDLLTLEEEKIDEMTRELRFNIPFLAKRLIIATDWIEKNHSSLPIGYFGASTGAAAALVAAAHKRERVRAVISRGGRPDLARSDLKNVTAPTLFIVGSLDEEVIELNRAALQTLQCIKKLEIVPGASHLFEEAGKLQIVANLAALWFQQYLPRSSA